MLLDHPVLSASDHTLSRSPNQLAPCVYIALRCQHCGELRQGLASAPLEESISCPVCSAACNFQLLGRGLTTSHLPFHELYPPEQTRWITHDPNNDGSDNDAPAVYSEDIHTSEARSENALTPAAHSEDARNAAYEPQALDGS